MGPELNKSEEKQLDRIVDGLIEDWLDEHYGLPEEPIEDVA